MDKIITDEIRKEIRDFNNDENVHKLIRKILFVKINI